MHSNIDWLIDWYIYVYSIKCILCTVGSVDVYVCITVGVSYQRCILHSAAACIACELGHFLKWETGEPDREMSALSKSSWKLESEVLVMLRQVHPGPLSACVTPVPDGVPGLHAICNLMTASLLANFVLCQCIFVSFLPCGSECHVTVVTSMCKKIYGETHPCIFAK